MKLVGFAVVAVCLVALSACATARAPYHLVGRAPEVAGATSTQRDLSQLPRPANRLTVAVYNFQDQTGQFRDGEGTQTLSRAVSQGATSILVKALQDASQRLWFQVIERERLDNLLKERQIIREMRQRYLGETEVNPDVLPSLLFAGLLLEGGIIGYDTNTVSGGLGARYLGIGASTQYRQDTVTVYLRAVSVKTGEVLTTVVSRKTVASVSVGADAFRYVAFRELLEAEAGISTNEPDQLALQQAIEKAVHSLILEGVQLGYWRFENAEAGAALLDTYDRAKRGIYSSEAIPRTSPVAEETTFRRRLFARSRGDAGREDRGSGAAPASSE